MKLYQLFIVLFINISSSCILPIDLTNISHVRVIKQRAEFSQDINVRCVQHNLKIKKMKEQIEQFAQEKTITSAELRIFKQSLTAYRVEQRTLKGFNITNPQRFDKKFNDVRQIFEQLCDNSNRSIIMKTIKKLYDHGQLTEEQANQLLHEVQTADKATIEKILPQFKQMKDRLDATTPTSTPKADK